MVRVRRYSGFGDEINVTVAYMQAGLLLDLAGEAAIKKNSVEDITNVAAGWLELAARLDGVEQEEVELESEPGYKMGFRPNEAKEDVEEDDDDEYEPDEVPLIEPGEE